MAPCPDERWRSVAELSGLLLSEEDQETTLKRVADLALRSIPGCDVDAAFYRLSVASQNTHRKAPPCSRGRVTAAQEGAALAL